MANLSHELRTPLNAILDFSQLLGMSAILADGTKVQRYVGQIEVSGKHLLSLIETMLDYAKVEAGKLSLTVSTVSLPQAVAEAVAMLQTHAERQQVLIDLDCAPDVTTVEVDATRLRQILTNLIDNAIKFSRPGGLVQVRTARLPGGGWQVEVRDQGIGISADNLPRLFSPFLQLSSGATKTHAGTGLGLALVRRIARAMGGDVTAASVPNQVTTFTLTMPAGGADRATSADYKATAN